MTYQFKTEMQEPLLFDTERMDDEQLARAAANPANIWRDKAEEEIRWRKRARGVAR